MTSIAPTPHGVDMGRRPDVTAFFDEQTNTVTYVVRDPDGTSCQGNRLKVIGRFL